MRFEGRRRRSVASFVAKVRLKPKQDTLSSHIDDLRGTWLAGILMIAGALTWLSVPIALFIGTVGAVSVFKAVYIDKRELKCARVGGSSNVPLGFVSLTENVMMVAMAIWMSWTALAGSAHIG
jgi:hypothetical protein